MNIWLNNRKYQIFGIEEIPDKPVKPRNGFLQNGKTTIRNDRERFQIKKNVQSLPINWLEPLGPIQWVKHYLFYLKNVLLISISVSLDIVKQPYSEQKHACTRARACTRIQMDACTHAHRHRPSVKFLFPVLFLDFSHDKKVTISKRT